MGASAKSAQFATDEVTQLLKDLQEATRATPFGGPQSYVPPKGGEIAEANYHHFIFGQRGSGKSSLLRHLQETISSENRAAVWIDQEIFANLSYPDVLVSAVHELIKGAREALMARIPEAPKKSLLKRLVRSKDPVAPIGKLAQDLSDAANQLELLKFAPLDRKVQWTVNDEVGNTVGVGAGVKMKIVSLDAKTEANAKLSVSSSEVVEGSKEQYLERALTNFRDLISATAKETGGGFVFVDDLYQLRRDVQPLVLGYLHRLVKDTGIWLKIGSIRYSTITFKPGDPPRGMQIGHDAHEVPLDRGLRHFKATQDFLEQILSKISAKSHVDIKRLFTEEARKRLVLAAGGVARDYLRLASGSITEARNRGVSEKTGSDRVIVEDVNKAAGLISPSKFDDLRKDEPAEAQVLEKLVRQITEFCRARKSAYFLVATDELELSEQINKLQHLRFTHLLVESETVPDKGSQRFNVWLLDVAELSAQRATNGMDFLKWEKRENRRNRKLIFTIPVDNETTGTDVSAGESEGGSDAAPTQLSLDE
jgi:energy-coupling factor transporter ATP-binding protein EcfA2